MRIYIVSAYPTVRAGLRALVRERAGWEVVGEAGPALPRPEGVPPSAPGTPAEPDDRRTAAEPVDVLLADLDAANGAEQLTTLVQVIQPRAGVVAIGAARAASDRPDAPGAQPPLVPGALAASLGALGLGLLPRDATAEEIVSAVEAVAHGLVVLDRAAARRLLAGVRTPTAASAAGAGEQAPPLPGEALTAREHEVLQLLAEGLPNKLIATRLHVSEHTAKFHVASIMTKLGAASRTEAVTLAARRGLLIL